MNEPLIDNRDYEVWTRVGYVGVWTWVEENDCFMALFCLDGEPRCIALPQVPIKWKLEVSEKSKLF